MISIVFELLYSLPCFNINEVVIKMCKNSIYTWCSGF